MQTLNHPLVPIGQGIISAANKAFSRLMNSRQGWARFRPALFDLSSRWQWWSLVLITKRLPPLPYPKIEFAMHFPDQAAPLRMIRECLRPVEARFDVFLDWLLFAFGAFDVREIPLSITPALATHWEATFDLALMVNEAGDWLGHYYETEIASRGMRSATGFFSTPMTLCQLMVELNKPGLTDSVHEPCCGSGRMLMVASNHSIHLSGNDNNRELVKIASLNGWLYVPSLVLPCREIETERTIQLDRKIKNVLKKGDQNESTRNQFGGGTQDGAYGGSIRGLSSRSRVHDALPPLIPSPISKF